MKKLSSSLTVLLAVGLFITLCACETIAPRDQNEDTTKITQESGAPTETAPIVPEETTAVTSEVMNPEPTQKEPIDIETIGGAIIVGKIGYYEEGWYLQPEQPLNVKYEYFLDNPSVFPRQTRIAMFDPAVDGVEKARYLGHTVTMEGTFRFYRDDFETLYFAPYTITLGKLVLQSHGAPDLIMPQEPEDLYDPSRPLPKYMDPMVQGGQYIYNAFMLSEESIRLMGNDFADFYVGFVDAFLNYRSTFECPEKRFAEMLSSIIYYDFPLYSACAETVEYMKHYDPETKLLSIVYKYDEQTHSDMIARFMEAANTLLADTSPDKTDAENAKSIYHALCTRMTYDHSALTEYERKESYYAYLYNSGVCTTFAYAYNQLLTQVGIKTTLAHCTSIETIGHSWSVITIDDKQYFCDPTYELNYDGGSGYRFFGMNYADRIADGTGAQGIGYGRYYTHPLDTTMIAEQSLDPSGIIS